MTWISRFKEWNYVQGYFITGFVMIMLGGTLLFLKACVFVGIGSVVKCVLCELGGGR